MVQFGQQCAERVPLPCKTHPCPRQEPRYCPWPCGCCPDFDQPGAGCQAAGSPPCPLWGGDIMMRHTAPLCCLQGFRVAFSEQWVGTSSCSPLPSLSHKCCVCPGLRLCTRPEATESGLADPASCLCDGDGGGAALGPQHRAWGRVEVWLWASLSESITRAEPLSLCPGNQAPHPFRGPTAICKSQTSSMFCPHSLVPRRAADTGPCPHHSGMSVGPMSPGDGKW